MMLIEDVQPSTLGGVKRLAAQIKREKGIRHSDALDLAARAANCTNFRNAQRTLPMKGNALQLPYILLTHYWRDEKKQYQLGRETLRIALKSPILNLCKKSDLKYVRGFGDLRMVAEDHFVCDSVSPSRSYARGRLSTAERSLRFMEHTGLRPCRDLRKANPKFMAQGRLPNIDHSTDWIDPETGQYVLIDEPYKGAPDENARSNWATRNGWEIAKTAWAGMYSPNNCDLYVATDATTGYDLSALASKINAMPEPFVSENWNGESASSWDTFVSPMATTEQDERRARCRGTKYPEASKTTVPYSYALGDSRRRPIGELSIPGHTDAGRTIKAALSSGVIPSGAWTRLCSLRSTLEDWLHLEIGPEGLPGPEFFEVYYRRTDEDKAYETQMQAPSDIVLALGTLRRKLCDAYPDCAPLRQQLRRIDMATSMIEKAQLLKG